MPTNEDRQFAVLKRRLRQQKEIADYFYDGERTIIVIPGFNFELTEAQQIRNVLEQEERFLFFLFLLRFPGTKIIYVTSVKLKPSIINYYLDIVAQSPAEKDDMARRLTFVSLSDRRKMPLARKLLKHPEKIKDTKTLIENPRTAHIRCYNSTGYEKKLAVALNVPLYAVDERLQVFGTKTGSRRIFVKAGIPLIPGKSNLKTFPELARAIVDLSVKYSQAESFILKLNKGVGGEGNLFFNLKKFLDTIGVSNILPADQFKKIIAQNIRTLDEFRSELSRRYYPQYFEAFKNQGGVLELYLSGKKKFSPSAQIRITPSGKIYVLSTHEQILGGPGRVNYLGCTFPAHRVYRKKIINYAYRVGRIMRAKGVIGRFAIDFLAVKENKDFKIYGIEINLRKGSTTHPFELAKAATGARYRKSNGLLYSGRTPIYYLDSYIRSPRFKILRVKELVELTQQSGYNYNPKTKKGIIIHLFSTIRDTGRIMYTSIGHSPEEVRKIYIDFARYLEKKVKNYPR